MGCGGSKEAKPANNNTETQEKRHSLTDTKHQKNEENKPKKQDVITDKSNREPSNGVEKGIF